VEAAGVEPASDNAPGPPSTRVVSRFYLAGRSTGDRIPISQPAWVFRPDQRTRSGRQLSLGDALFGGDSNPREDRSPD